MWECKMVQPHWKVVWYFLIKLNRQSSSYPANGFLRIHPKKWKLMFKEKPMPEPAAALFITTKRKPVQQVNKLVHPNYGILVSNKKEWTIVTYSHFDESPGTDVEWKKKCQPSKATYCVIPFMQHFQKENILEMEEEHLVIADGWGP